MPIAPEKPLIATSTSIVCAQVEPAYLLAIVLSGVAVGRPGRAVLDAVTDGQARR